MGAHSSNLSYHQVAQGVEPHDDVYFMPSKIICQLGLKPIVETNC